MPLASKSVLLLSGGLDSTALAAIERPALCLAIDYGQRPAEAEIRAASAIAGALGLEFQSLRLDLGVLGGGLLKDDDLLPQAPSPEWWPFRNQILVTAAASVALGRGLDMVVVGSVAGDGDRHVDGTARFYDQLDALLGMQEGSIHVSAPAIHETSAHLLARSGLRDDMVGWTISCHRSVFPCGECPGCWKRASVLAEVGLLQAPLR
jgi:7-cyano-7-deazaguanine synthase